MRFRALRVQGWRCFANPLALEDFSPGLNVIHGPNGSGKSTLMNALVRAFFERHNTKSESVRALRPWSRALAPRVTLDYELGGKTFRIQKRFLEEASSEIFLLEGERKLKQAESRAADDFARALLQGEESKKRELDVQSWGLAQILWAPQGGMEIEQLTGSLREALQTSLGAQTTSLESSAVEKRIAAEYEAIFTPSGNLRKGESASPAMKLSEAFESAKGEVQTLREQYSRFEDASRSIEDLRRSAEAAAAEARESDRRLETLQSECERYAAMLAAIENGKFSCDAAEAQAQRLRSQIEELERVRTEILKLKGTLEAAEQARPALAAERERGEAEAAACEAEVERVRMGREEVDRARSLAEAAAIRQQASEKIAVLRRTTDRLTAELSEQQSIRRKREEILAPSANQLAALRKASARARESQVRLDASLVRLTLTAERDLEVRRITPENAPVETLAAGARFEATGLTQASLQIVGIGLISAAGPEGSAEQYRREADEAAAQWRKLREPFGDASLEELEHRTELAAQCDRELSASEARLAAILDRSSYEELRAELVRQEAILRDLLARRPDWEAQAPSAHEAAVAAQRLESDFRTAIDSAERRRQLAQAAAEAIVRRIMLHDAEARSLSLRLDAVRARYDELRADGLDDDRRRSAYESALLRFHAAQASLASETKKLAEFPNDPRQEAEALLRRRESQREAAAKAQEELYRREARLMQLAEEAPYSKLAAAEELAASLSEELRAAQLKAGAAKLLFETLVQVRNEASRKLLDPIQKRASASLRRIGGGKFEHVSLHDSLTPAGVATAFGGDEPRAIDELSGGEREQLHFAVRLALAEIAFERDRLPIVLDDVFVYTDAVRLTRTVNILEETAERFQILLLTCHPERYRSLREAKFYDLADLVRSSEESA